MHLLITVNLAGVSDKSFKNYSTLKSHMRSFKLKILHFWEDPTDCEILCFIGNLTN